MIRIFNGFIKGLGKILQLVLLILPESPFKWIESKTINNEWLQNANYILPFNQAVSHLSLFVSAVAVYFGLRIILRWIKASQS